MKKRITRTLRLASETIRTLRTVDLTRAIGGVMCSDPTCHNCDTIDPQPGCTPSTCPAC